MGGPSTETNSQETQVTIAPTASFTRKDFRRARQPKTEQELSVGQVVYFRTIGARSEGKVEAVFGPEAESLCTKGPFANISHECSPDDFGGGIGGGKRLALAVPLSNIRIPSSSA